MVVVAVVRVYPARDPGLEHQLVSGTTTTIFGGQRLLSVTAWTVVATNDCSDERPPATSSPAAHGFTVSVSGVAKPSMQTCSHTSGDIIRVCLSQLNFTSKAVFFKK